MSQSQKTLEFLQKLKDIGHWNDDYDYSEDDLKIRRALSVTTNIEFYKYKVNFKLHQ